MLSLSLSKAKRKSRLAMIMLNHSNLKWSNFIACTFSNNSKKNLAEAFQLKESDIRESFVKGRGPGGQKINKVRNCVQLMHVPTGIFVHCQDARDLTSNRAIARKLLRDKVEYELLGKSSKIGRAITKKKKRKAKMRSRAKNKRKLSEEHEEESSDDIDLSLEKSVHNDTEPRKVTDETEPS